MLAGYRPYWTLDGENASSARNVNFLPRYDERHLALIFTSCTPSVAQCVFPLFLVFGRYVKRQMFNGPFSLGKKITGYSHLHSAEGSEENCRDRKSEQDTGMTLDSLFVKIVLSRNNERSRKQSGEFEAPISLLLSFGISKTKPA